MSSQSETLLNYSDTLIPVEGETEGLTQTEFIARKRSDLPSLDAKPSIEELLNIILPPRVISVDDQVFRNPVSPIQSSRKQLDELEGLLEDALYRRQARKQGICQVREEVHNQLFDEIIRQSTINCPERGLLLLRVRDNIKMTFAAYKTLYHGSVVFGNKKAFAAHVGVPEMEQKIKDLKKRKIMLQNKKVLLQNELDATQRSFREIKAIEEKRKQDELNYLRAQTKQLDEYLHNNL